jgi:hypothetical protein
MVRPLMWTSVLVACGAQAPAPAPYYEPAAAPQVAKVMLWWGKVNQHFDLEHGVWLTDPDGRSGADVDVLAYCRKWYPSTVGVRELGYETISTWRAAGNEGAFTATKLAYECVAAQDYR